MSMSCWLQKEKILYRKIGSKVRAVLAEMGFLWGNTIFMIICTWICEGCRVQRLNSPLPWVIESVLTFDSCSGDKAITSDGPFSKLYFSIQLIYERLVFECSGLWWWDFEFIVDSKLDVWYFDSFCFVFDSQFHQVYRFRSKLIKYWGVYYNQI